MPDINRRLKRSAVITRLVAILFCVNTPTLLNGRSVQDTGLITPSGHRRNILIFTGYDITQGFLERFLKTAHRFQGQDNGFQHARHDWGEANNIESAADKSSPLYRILPPDYIRFRVSHQRRVLSGLLIPGALNETVIKRAVLNKKNEAETAAVWKDILDHMVKDSLSKTSEPELIISERFDSCLVLNVTLPEYNQDLKRWQSQSPMPFYGAAAELAGIPKGRIVHIDNRPESRLPDFEARAFKLQPVNFGPGYKINTGYDFMDQEVFINSFQLREGAKEASRKFFDLIWHLSSPKDSSSRSVKPDQLPDQMQQIYNPTQRGYSTMQPSTTLTYRRLLTLYLAAGSLSGCDTTDSRSTIPPASHPAPQHQSSGPEEQHSKEDEQTNSQGLNGSFYRSKTPYPIKLRRFYLDRIGFGPRGLTCSGAKIPELDTFEKAAGYATAVFLQENGYETSLPEIEKEQLPKKNLLADPLPDRNAAGQPCWSEIMIKNSALGYLLPNYFRKAEIFPQWKKIVTRFNDPESRTEKLRKLARDLPKDREILIGFMNADAALNPISLAKNFFESLAVSIQKEPLPIEYAIFMAEHYLKTMMSWSYQKIPYFEEHLKNGRVEEYNAAFSSGARLFFHKFYDQGYGLDPDFDKEEIDAMIRGWQQALIILRIKDKVTPPAL